MNKYVPSKIKSSSICQPLINCTLKQMRMCEQQSYNKARSTNLPGYWLYYKQLKKKCKKNAINHTTSICQISYMSPMKMAKRRTLQLYKIISH